MYESWTHNKSDIKLNGYESFNFYRRFQNRRANRCSGGIVLYLKDSISDGIKVVKNHANSIIWLKLDKNYFKIESDVYIAGVKIHLLIILLMLIFSPCCKMISLTIALKVE